MQTNTSKQKIRKTIKELLKDTLDSNGTTLQKKLNENIEKILQTSKIFLDSNLLLAYYPMKHEASCLDILNVSLRIGKKIALPKITGDIIHFHFSDLRNLKKNSYGIYEPTNEAIDFKTLVQEQLMDIAILVPALAFTKNGKRLGRGKGYYDKFLNSMLKLQEKYPTVNITFIGLCFSFQILDEIPTEEHDIKMNYILTEKDLYGE